MLKRGTKKHNRPNTWFVVAELADKEGKACDVSVFVINVFYPVCYAVTGELTFKVGEYASFKRL